MTSKQNKRISFDLRSFVPIMVYYLIQWYDCLIHALILTPYRKFRVWYLGRKILKFETQIYWLSKINPGHRGVKKEIDTKQRKTIQMKMDLGRIKYNLQRHKYEKK